MTNMSTFKQTACIDCPKTMVGRVIGKGGETIKSLQQYTGAMIQIDQSQDPTKVTIAGSPTSLQLAVSMVNDIVNGHFKGFALLRQITNRSGTLHLAQPQPVYVEGYGFVPLSQAGAPVSVNSGDSVGARDDSTIPSTNGLHMSPSDMLLFAAQHNLRSQSLPDGDMHKMDAMLKIGSSSKRTSLDSTFSDPIFASFTQGGGVDTLSGLNLDMPSLSSLQLNSPPHSPTISSPNSSAQNYWMQICDPDARPFWYNKLTGQAVWKRPY